MASLDRFFRSNLFWLLFAAAVVFVYFFGLTVPLLGPDEPRYAQVAREMYERGDWVTTTLGGHNWFEKPALLYWLQIVSFNIFGTTEFAARFGSAIFGLGTIVSLYIFGRSAQGEDSSQFAKYLAMVAATSLGLIVFSRGASFDIILTFPITASLVGFFVFDQAEKTDTRKRAIGLVAFYFFIGVALLAKGLVGIVFPFAIVGFYHVLSMKMPERSLVLSGFWGLLISAAVAATWYVPMYLVNGWEFIDEFFIQHHFQRY
ncbi:MAG: phospholipid carrier-dependent glycosyltransferase, partial [Pyrinomonadaceae bacterium]|nr:phospholipid carrier-dependent glycosyltransferase [Pyrinomonadaceae bacterium]